MIAASSLAVSNLVKRYGYVTALGGVSLDIAPGEVRGLLGPNGSGKSTLLKICVGLLKPTSGNVRVLGVDVERDSMSVKRAVGYVPETPRLYEFLTGTEYLDFVGDVRGLGLDEKKTRIKRFIDSLDLEGKEGHLISSYSQGMKQKIAIMGALLHRPRFLVLDEPLNGLDPKSARVVKELLHELAREGVSTIFSTHVLEIAEAICNSITILQNGYVIAEGSPDDLRKKAGLPGSGLEDVFMKLTGTNDVAEIVRALVQ